MGKSGNARVPVRGGGGGGGLQGGGGLGRGLPVGGGGDDGGVWFCSVRELQNLTPRIGSGASKGTGGGGGVRLLRFQAPKTPKT